MKRFINLFMIIFPLILISCGGGSNNEHIEKDNSIVAGNKDSVNNNSAPINKQINQNRFAIRRSHHINTTANEYLPVLSGDGKTLYFSAMDRTGYFDFKIDFNEAKNCGGEDIYFSKLENGVWTDARPVSFLNTNGHETVTDVLNDESFLLTANYPEKLGPQNSDKGAETTDLFFAKKKGNTYQIFHFPEPVNSIFGEFDAIMDKDQSFILFASDRPGHVGDYHKKGWAWNKTFWGNTDIYVSFKEGNSWSVPKNLGLVVNTQGAERTPWLSEDGLTLYLSSNGHQTKNNNLDVYSFKRKNKNDWDYWDGPFEITDANSDGDDWGYKETTSEIAYFARVTPLGFVPTQGGYAGDGGIRETNFRTGYKVFGAQSAGLKKDGNTDIYELLSKNIPSITLSNVLFEFNSYQLRTKYAFVIDAILDLCNQNQDKKLEIYGYTDNIGEVTYNKKLSENRSEEIKRSLMLKGVKNDIMTYGLGSQKPLNDNSNEEKREKNRRVEIFLIDKK